MNGKETRKKFKIYIIKYVVTDLEQGMLLQSKL